VDQIVPVDDASRLSAQLVTNSTRKVNPGASHEVFTVNADKVNADLLAFLKANAQDWRHRACSSCRANI
jgi:non-heme chloroperoxidase